MINIKQARYFAIILLLACAPAVNAIASKAIISKHPINVKIIDPSLTIEENKILNVLESLTNDKGNGKTLQQSIAEIVNHIKSNPTLIKDKPIYKTACDVLTEINDNILNNVTIIRISEIDKYKSKIETILNKYKLEGFDSLFPNNVIRYFRNILTQRKIIMQTRGKIGEPNKAKLFLLLKLRLKGK